MPVRRLLWLTILLCLLPCSSASASRAQSLTFEAPRDLMNPITRPAALNELESLGVRSLRVNLTWSTVAPGAGEAQKPPFEPTDPDAYAWGEYDALMAAAKARDWPVLLTVTGPVPRWATKSKLDNRTRPSAPAFAAFMTAVGRRYGEQVSTWSIWNEPNQPQFLRPQFADGGRATSPLIYRSLFLAGQRGLRKAGQGDDTILLGETSPRGTSRVVAPLTFLRGALCLDREYKRVGKCAPLSAGGYAHHAYTTRQGPTFKPPPNDVTIGVLSRLSTALDRARRAGALTEKLPIHLTEFGIQSTPDTLSGVSLAKQVEYRAISEKIAYDNPRVVSFSQYLLRDSDPTGPKQYDGFESGLRFADGRPKPSLPAFRLPLAVTRRGSKASIWGLVRPAIGSTSATISYANKGSSRFLPLKTVQTNALGYFTLQTTYRAGRRWNVSAQGHTGSPVGAYSR
ncbi:MAG TPA: hypothetical protein VGO80_13880 [Solirubrobacteraceae bacterium]|jgi:hypothetical protein|nr:hypothetical protein [Solirubrobacteraceae bacterium]